MADILPVSGTLQFVSNMTQQDIVLSVLPDNIPEVAEVSLGNWDHTTHCDLYNVPPNYTAQERIRTGG